MKKTLLTLLVVMMCTLAAEGQRAGGADAAATSRGFWTGWRGELGVDMSLQAPNGQSLRDVFPNGKSFGLDIGVGKWFAPEFGLRFRLNWENGFLRDDHARWLHAFSQGYLAFVGDMQLSLPGMLGRHSRERRWDVFVFPRAGGLYNIHSRKGSPLLGVGVGGTYRLKGRWSIYADAAYQVMSSVNGFKTDTGTGHNGYFDVQAGVQFDLDQTGTDRHSAWTRTDGAGRQKAAWGRGWFVQAGIGMSLLNPYGANFSHVFPNGSTFGVNAAGGKWFTPEVGLRAGLNWQNGIVGNNRLEWMDPEGQPGGNHDGGGYGAVCLDVMFNLHNIIGGYDASRRWQTRVFPRVGLDSNLAAHTASPLVGFGAEQTFRLNRRLSLFADIAYQVTTSEFMDSKSYTGPEGSNSNGWMDLNVGLLIDL